MSLKRRVARNILWNWSGQIVVMLAGFLVAPFLVHRLGRTGYGLWILMGSLSGYFGLLDLGLRGSVGRNMAFYRAKGDPRTVNSVLSTAAALLCVAGVVAFLGVLVFLPYFVRLFDIPPDQAGPARLALFLVGVNLALILPTNVFDATLWGFQRFDLINATDIVAFLVRTGLIVGVVLNGYGVVGLAWVTIVSTLGAAAVKAFACFRVEPTLRIGVGYVGMKAARELFGFGLWNFAYGSARMFTSQFSNVLVGARMNVSSVTPYNIASRLVGYANSMVSSSAGVLTPMSASFHAEEDHDRQRRLFIEGGKANLALSLFFAGGFLLLGGPFISLWMGPEFAGVSLLLAILTVGEALPMAQWTSASTIMGLGRPRTLALISMAEGAAVIGLLVALGGSYGLVGVCLAFAIPATLFRGVAVLYFGTRLNGVPVVQYLAEVFVPVIPVAAAPLALLALATRWRMPGSWAEMVGFAGAYGLAFLLSSASLVGYGRLLSLTSSWYRRPVAVRD